MKLSKSNSTWIFLTASFILFTCSILFPQDKTKSLDERAKDLVSRLTLEEKIALIVGDGRFLPKEQIQMEKVTEQYIANRNSKMLIPRLGIKTTSLTDVPSGINKQAPKEGEKNAMYTT